MRENVSRRGIRAGLAAACRLRIRFALLRFANFLARFIGELFAEEIADAGPDSVLPIVETLDGRRGFDMLFRRGGPEIVRIGEALEEGGGIVDLVNAELERIDSTR